MKGTIIRISISVVALGLIAYGGYLAFPPLGFILPGGLLWIDLSRKG